MRVRFCDEFDGGFGWIVDELRGRTSHAVAVDGAVWLVDPVDAPGVDERVRALGEPAGIVQLLDRHNRDAAALSRRLGVPYLRVPRTGGSTPFELIAIVDLPRWREVALWWPGGRVLAVADALGTLPYFRAGGEQLGVYPWLRLTPPAQLGELDPLHVLCGHGEGVHGEAASAALRSALRTSRLQAPAAFVRGGGWLAAELARRARLGGVRRNPRRSSSRRRSDGQ